MDDTTQNRASDGASAATRKRRSSILKSQRPPRTPFCELEFNVSSHTDTNNSRRVSFSRRTGVAEFATNEATTTWKNFYEELNKSLETSGNESEMKHGKQLVAHLGKTIFDQQFEEVKAVDFIGTLNPGINISTLINNMDFAEVECTDSKLIAPHSNFELSACTETQNKLFKDDLAITCAEEVTDRIDINFSAIQQIGEKDDLEEIEKDLQHQSNMAVCQGPFPRQNLSEYIELDLNMTHAAIAIHESDMSITDTIHSPEVQDVSKTTTLDKKKKLVEKDWVVDKENIVVNPYVAPPESLNFAVNEEPDKVLVFDGKKLLVETENPKNENYRRTLLPYPPESVPQRKEIVLNCIDDLPNFINKSQVSKSTPSFVSEVKQSIIREHGPAHQHFEDKQNKQKTIIFDDFSDMTMTQAIPNVIKTAEKRRTIVYDGEIENISITQALPSNIIDNKRIRPIVYEDDNDNISITQTVPPCEVTKDKELDDISDTSEGPANVDQADVMSTDNNMFFITKEPYPPESVPQSKAIVLNCSDDLPNFINESQVSKSTSSFVSEVKQSIIKDHGPAHPHFEEKQNKHKTRFFDDLCDMTMTQAIPNVIKTAEKRRTIVYDGEKENISITQAIPSNIIDNKKMRLIVYEDDNDNMSITQAVPPCEVTKDKELDDISDTSEGPANVDQADVMSTDNNMFFITKQPYPPESVPQRKAIVLNCSDDLPNFINESQVSKSTSSFVSEVKQSIIKDHGPAHHHFEDKQNKQKTIIFDDFCDMTMTQAIPNVIKTAEKRRTIVHDGVIENISITQALPSNIQDNEKMRTIVYEDDNDNMSITQAVPPCEVTKDKELDDISDTSEGPANVDQADVLSTDNNMFFITKEPYPPESVPQSKAIVLNCSDDLPNFINESQVSKSTSSFVSEVKQSIIKDHGPAHHHFGDKQNKQKTRFFDDLCDMTITQAIPNVIKTAEKRRTIVYYGEIENISITQALPSNIIDNKKMRTIVYEDDNDKTSITQAVPPCEVTKDKELDDISDTSEGPANVDQADVMSTDNNLFFITKEPYPPESVPQRKAVLNCSDDLPNLINESQVSKSTSFVSELKQSIIKDPGPTQQHFEDKQKKQKTRFFEDLCDMTMTQPIPNVIKTAEKRRTIVYDGVIENISITQALPSNIKDNEKMRTIVYEDDNDNMSITQAAPPCEVTKDKELYDISDTSEGPANIDQADVMSAYNNMFFITKTSEDDCQTDKSKVPLNIQPYIHESVDNSTLCIQYKNNDEPSIIQDLENNLSILKKDMKVNSVSQSKVSEQNRFDEFERGSKVSLDLSKRKSAKGFKTANDTKELLEMISDFTDKRQSRIPTLKEIEENEIVFEQIPIETRSSLENNMESTKREPMCNRNLKRLSMALSREVLMNNLSMASAVLQKSRNDFDDSDIADESINTPNETHRKSVRINTDIIKKLTFDDSSSDRSISSQTPLKKTAFGEISYMTDSSPKVKVIPEFMKNVSDGIKELMDDLVKPVTEVMPFNTSTLDRSLRRDPSTCSTQIQANLSTSSQIDLQTELYSNTNSVSDVNKLDSADMINEAVNRSMSRALRSPVKSVVDSVMDDVEDKSVKTDDFDNTSNKTAVPQTKNYYIDTGNVLVFDHANPLNNVLLAPPAPYAIDIHRYNPIQSNNKIIEENLSEIINDAENLPEHRVTNQYRLELKLDGQKLETLDKTDTHSVSSNTSQPMLIDHFTEPELCKGKDMEVNTLIAMKENRELLDASSSLTLVDGAMDRIRTVTSENSVVIVADQKDTANSPVKVIYQVDEPSPTSMDSDITSTDNVEEIRKPKKRVYSPTKREKHLHCTISSLDGTPVPLTKMQKRSLSPVHPEPNKLPAERDPSPELFASHNKSPKQISDKKPGSSVTVQQMMVHVKGVKVAQKARMEEMSETASSEVTSSCTSSNNLRADSSPRPSHDVSTNPSRSRWLPDTSSNSVVSCNDNPDEDIVAIINAMPFMGSNECRWECVGESGWTLLLLHSRVRLTIRFAPTPFLRPDTPVVNTELEMLHLDKKNSIAYLCVSFACEKMRYCVSRGCSSAGEVGKLLRRLAATARLAAQWARSMHDAKARLAYSLSPDGWLALKVANISLRTVWEVSMRLELVMESARTAPWPRACDVRVSRVACAPAAAPPPPAAVSRLLAATPHDWGHAPTTLWKLFRYLKHMKRDGDV